jgi:hypothetical protein
MQHRIYDKKGKLAAEALFKVTFIRWHDQRAVTVHEAITKSQLGATLLTEELRKEAADPTHNADLKKSLSEKSPGDTSSSSRDVNYTRMLRGLFVFGETVLSRESAPDVFKYHPYLCMYDEGEVAERAALRGKSIVASADALHAELQAVPVKAPKK